LAIAEESKKMTEGVYPNGKQERGRKELSPLRMRGGGRTDDEEDEEEVPFTGIEMPGKRDLAYILEKSKEIDTPSMAEDFFNHIEEGLSLFLDPNRSRRRKERHGMLLAHVIKEATTRVWDRLMSTSEGYERTKEENIQLHKKLEEARKELEKKEKEDIVKKETGTQTKLGPARRDKDMQTETQPEVTTGMDIETDDITEERTQTPKIQERLDEILKKIENLERKSEDKKTKDTSPPWSEVVKRKNKRTIQDPPLQNNRKGTMQKDPAEERNRNIETEREKKKTTLRMLKRKISRGTGIIIELHSNNLREYEYIIKRCQEEISLEELGIPPIGIKKTRTGGILLEVRCEEKEEEKAEKLADRIKEMVRSVEGAQVRRPLRRLRLRIRGLPFGATATEVAEAVARVGDGQAGSVRVGPLRTSVSGAVTAWADCPRQVAIKAAEAAELTLGWARVGVTLERGGAPPVPPLPSAWAPEAVVPLRG